MPDALYTLSLKMPSLKKPNHTLSPLLLDQVSLCVFSVQGAKIICGSGAVMVVLDAVILKCCNIEMLHGLLSVSTRWGLI